MIRTMDEQDKPKRGRPKGAKDKKPRKKREFTEPIEFPMERKQLVDPKTGTVVQNSGRNAVIIQRMGDERVTAFVQYHMDMLIMREGCNKKDVPDLYQRFYRYLQYCAEHGVIPNNMNAYFAIGITRSDISNWKRGGGNSEQQKFAEDLLQFFASVHEQAPTDGLMNPISAMFWQKAHDGMIEASKLEVTHTDPLGEKASAEDIAKRYEGVDLPE